MDHVRKEGNKGHNIVRSLLFLGLFVILLAAASRVLIPKWSYPEQPENTWLQIRGILRLDKDRVDAVFLGTSPSEFGVSPMQIYRDQGIVSVNLCTSGQTPETSLFLAQRILKRQSPKVLVLDAAGLFYTEEDDHGINYRYVLEAAPFSFSEEEYRFIRACLRNKYTYEKITPGKRDILRDLISCVFPFYNYHDRWNKLNESDFHFPVKDYFLMGYLMSSDSKPSETDVDEMNETAEYLSASDKQIVSAIDRGRMETTEEDSVYFPITVSESAIQTLRDLKNLCEENDCELLVTKVPAVKSPRICSSAWPEVRYKEIRRVTSELGIEYVDLLYDGAVEFDWSEDTKDSGAHLNFRGAKKVSEFFGKYLRDRYGIGAKAYEDYERRSVSYEKAAAAAELEMETDLTEYMAVLSRQKERFAVMISVKDDMRAALTGEDIKALRSLGLKTDFEEMEEGDSFAALIDRGKVVYEARSNQKIRKEAELRDGTGVLLESAGCFTGNRSTITINGTGCSKAGRGINIVVYDCESRLILDSVCFDTHDPEHGASHYRPGSYLDEYTWFLITNA